MKVSVDGVEVLNLSDTQKKVIKNDIDASVFDDDMKRRVKWVLEHKHERCMMRLRREWDQKLAARGVNALPVSDEEYANLVFSQPDYKDRAQREADAMAAEEERLAALAGQ